MILQMSDKDFTEMIRSAERFEISSFRTDCSLEQVSILANSYIYEFSNPSFNVMTGKDPVKLKKEIIRTINTTEIMGHKLINIIEERQRVDLSQLKADK